MVFLRRTAHVASIVILLLPSVAAQDKPSQPPRPSALKVGGDQKQATQPEQGGAKPEVTITQPAIPQAGQLVIQQTNAPEQHGSSDQYGTIIIAFLALGVAFLQYLVMRKQADISQVQTGISTEQNAIVTRQNTIMEEQNVITRAQNTIMSEELNAATAAAEATRKSFLLSHRPKVRIRNIDVPHLSQGSIRDAAMWATNIGSTVAHVFKVEIQWIYEDRLPPKSPFARTEATQTHRETIPAGGTRSLPVTGAHPTGLPPHFTTSPYETDGVTLAKNLFLIGIVKYWDDSQPPNLRHTAIGRRYNRDTGRFEKVNDEDYEHED